MALSGLLTAVLVDLDAWRKSVVDGTTLDFDMKIAVRRWIMGFVSGLTTGLTIYGSE